VSEMNQSQMMSRTHTQETGIDRSRSSLMAVRNHKPVHNKH